MSRQNGTSRGATPKPAEVPKGPGATVLPGIGGALARGFVTVLRDPVIVVTTIGLVTILWVVLLAAGLRFLPPSMVQVLALPPVSSRVDVSLAATFFSIQGWTLLWILGFTVVRAAVTAVLVGMIEESAQHGRVSLAGPIRGIQSFGSVLIYEYLCVLTGLLLTILGPSLGAVGGNLLPGLLPVVVMWFLSMAPFAAVRNNLRGSEAVRRSIKAARLPGWPRLLSVVALPFVLSTILVSSLVAPMVAQGMVDVTASPAFTTWILVFASAIVNVCFLATVGEYWRAAEPYIGQQTAERRPTRRPARPAR